MAKFKPRAVDATRVAELDSVTSQRLPSGGESILQEHTVTTFAARQNEIFDVGRIHDVPLRRIRDNPLNARVLYPASIVDTMAHSIEAMGQLTAATGFVDSDGDVVLIEGHTRFRAAQSLGLSTLRIEIKPKPNSDQDLYEESRASNSERHEQTPLDDALRWRELLARKVYLTQGALAKRLGLSDTQVSRVLALADLPNRLVQTLAEMPDLLGLKMLTALREYCTLKGEDETLELALEASRNGLGYRDVEARRKAAERGPIRRLRSIKRVVEFRSGKGEVRMFEVEGRIELSLKGLSADDANELLERLQKAMVI